MVLFLINILADVSHKRPICEVYLYDLVILSVIRKTNYIIQLGTFDKTYPDPNSNSNLEESNSAILVLSI
jgi:hypothetical protein